MRRLSSLLLVLFLLGLPAVSAFGRTSKKPAPAGTAKKSSKVSNSSKAKKTSRSSRRRASRRSTRRAIQTAPTPERYKEIQQALADRGYYDGEIDGQWGPSCVEALKRFQADQNLQVDGKLGALSLIALGLGPKREPMHAVPQFDSKPSEEQPQ